MVACSILFFSYNEYINSNENSTNEDLISESTEITYPFYMIIPFQIQGFAIQYGSYISCFFKQNCSKKNDNLISIRPITNNPLQRFINISNSSACNI